MNQPWVYMCSPFRSPPHTHTPPSPPIPQGLPSAPGPSACLMHPTWAGDLFHPRYYTCNGYHFKGFIFDLLNTRGGDQGMCSRDFWGLLFHGLMFDLSLISLPLTGLNLCLWSLLFLCGGQEPTSAHPHHSPPLSAAFILVFTAVAKVLAPLPPGPPPRPPPSDLSPSWLTPPPFIPISKYLWELCFKKRVMLFVKFLPKAYFTDHLSPHFP